MYLSRIRIVNFRNFSELDIPLSGNIVVVGENRVGKSNLLHALRLIFDAALPDSSRQLGLSDFWDGLGPPSAEDKIIVLVEIRDFEEDLDILAKLTDFRLDDDPTTVRLTYECRPRPDLEGDPACDEDFEFICYGGESEAKDFGHNLRRRISMDVLPALRDAEGDLAAWRRSPLRPLIEDAFKEVDRADLEKISEAIQAATAQVTAFNQVHALEENIASLFAQMSGPRHDIKPRLGLSPTDPTRLYRNIRLLIDEGLRGINDASLGSANLLFLSLKALELRQMMEENRRDHTVLAIEEPEAHLHPHLQRSVYRHLFQSVEDGEDAPPLSVLLTTHSPHIASVAPLRSLVLLKDNGESGSIGFSTASLDLTDPEADDLARYLDVTRAEMLFARGVILVEGDAERFLVPAFAQTLGTPLDHLGITVCSVAGTNFHPYAKVLTGLQIPVAIITDWDPRNDGKYPRGYNRALRLVDTIERTRTGEEPTDILQSLKDMGDYNDFKARCKDFGVFTNSHTLEIDLFQDDFAAAIIGTLREHNFGQERSGWIDEWEADANQLDAKRFLSLVDAIGKGRFAQRLVSRMGDLDPPEYISHAIEFVASRV